MKKYKSLIPILFILILFSLYLIFQGRLINVLKAKKQAASLNQSNLIEDCDIVFQTSLTPQSKAIQLATHSEYSHCGIVFKIKDTFCVFEAIQPVKYTSLNEWIARGKDSHYVVKRLKNANEILTNEIKTKMKEIGYTYNGKNYDIYFEWTDEKIYCSELVWKIYKKATGLEVGKLQKLKDFDLSNIEVTKLLKSRFGEKIPMDETIISPVGIFNSGLLTTITKK